MDVRVMGNQRQVILKLGMVVGVLVCLTAGTAVSTEVEEPDTQKEQRIRSLEGQLVAPCCWTQPVSEHRSGASSEVRAEILRMVEEGMTDDAVRAAFVTQYGKRILAQPPADGFDTLVYVLPPAFFLLGLVVLRIVHRRLSDRRNGVRSTVTAETHVDASLSEPQAESMVSRVERELADRE